MELKGVSPRYRRCAPVSERLCVITPGEGSTPLIPAIQDAVAEAGQLK